MEVPVMSAWQPRQRRNASLASTVLALAFIGLAVLALFVEASQQGNILLGLLVVLLLIFIFQALVVLSGLRREASAAPAEYAGGDVAAGGWQQSYAPSTPAPAAPSAPSAATAGEQLTLKCSSCGTIFDVTDTGERPLHHTCPGCGSEGLLTEADIGPPAPASAPPAETPAAPTPSASVITLKCGNCSTIFDVNDTGERPLRHTCPGCGSEGILREEDLGPAPAAAPSTAAAPAAAESSATRKPPARAAKAPSGAKTVKALKLRCKSCATVFTLRDTGERPLYHECPGCKVTGVVR